ncbi:MAG: toxic anion resistance protein [Selenomonadaceae bacterium]|nr:toxic anion resistance protein [Selenomonadaceae bacterium]
MADISLEDLLKAKNGGSEENAANLPVVTAEAVEKEVATLTPEERREVENIKSNINLMDSTASLSYGAAAQKDIASFSDNVLSSVKTKDAGDVGALLSELVGKVRGFQPNEDKGFLAKIPIIGSLAGKAESLMEGYTKLSTQVERIEGALESAKTRMMKDVVMFDGLYDKNLQYFKRLELYIRAGEEKLEEMQTVTIPRLRNEAANSGDPMAAQVVKDFEDSVARFEKKVHDLKLSKTIAIQTAPQIRLIQNNDKVLIDRVQTAIYNTIPLWKNQMVIALGLSRQKSVLQMQQAIGDATNDLLKQNAEMLKVNTIETAKENERSIVDIETVAKVNADLIETIEATIKIGEEGKARRAAAERELVKIENELKNKLMEVTGR